MTFRDILLIILCYLLGSIPFGYVLTRYKSGADIRDHGSGNIGATNVLRTQGKALGALTLVLDFAKAAASVWICRICSPGVPAANLASGTPKLSAIERIALALSTSARVAIVNFRIGSSWKVCQMNSSSRNLITSSRVRSKFSICTQRS